MVGSVLSVFFARYKAHPLQNKTTKPSSPRKASWKNVTITLTGSKIQPKAALSWISFVFFKVCRLSRVHAPLLICAFNGKPNNIQFPSPSYVTVTSKSFKFPSCSFSIHPSGVHWRNNTTARWSGTPPSRMSLILGIFKSCTVRNFYPSGVLWSKYLNLQFWTVGP